MTTVSICLSIGIVLSSDCTICSPSLSRSADCSSPSPGQRPGQAGRKHPRTVGDEQDRTGLDLWQGKAAIHHHIQHTKTRWVNLERVGDKGPLEPSPVKCVLMAH